MEAVVTIRLYLKTFNRLKKLFPYQRGETMASYFKRLAEYIEEIKEKAK